MYVLGFAAGDDVLLYGAKWALSMLSGGPLCSVYRYSANMYSYHYILREPSINQEHSQFRL